MPARSSERDQEQRWEAEHEGAELNHLAEMTELGKPLPEPVAATGTIEAA